MNKQSIEILNAIVKNDRLTDGYDKRLVIIEKRAGAYGGSSLPGAYVSVVDLTSEDFFEVYRYKKSLEESKDKKEK